LQIASQSALDCSDAAGEVNSIYPSCISSHHELSIQSVTHIVNSKIIQRLGNLDFLLSVEEGIGKLFTFAQCAFNDLEVRHVAQKVADGLVWVCSVGMGVGLGLDGGEAWVACKVEN